MAKRRLVISLKQKYAMHVTGISIKDNKLVYVIVANQKLKYETGRSKIVYIGSTEKGVARMSQSVASQADEILGKRGVREFRVRVVTCKGRGGVKTWRKLERAMLMVFRDLFGEVPLCNSHGKGFPERDEFNYFAHSRIEQILEEIG